MPESFRENAARAAALAGFDRFDPDACLLNRYEPGARLTLHQGRNERHPIVSVSLGLPAMFRFGGARPTDKVRGVPRVHGDVVVWGGPARLHYHGVSPLPEGQHPQAGRHRFNLTLWRAG